MVFGLWTRGTCMTQFMFYFGSSFGYEPPISGSCLSFCDFCQSRTRHTCLFVVAVIGVRFALTVRFN